MPTESSHSSGSRVPGPGSRSTNPTTTPAPAAISNSTPTIALVAGEDSGDQLGAHLIAALKRRFPDARFVGVGGPRMQAEGFEPWYDIGALSVMGFAEVLRHLPRLLALRRDLARRLLGLRPDVFIGIDAPDFNLGLERRLKKAGIPVAHYVSPSIWAWRENRAEKIGRSADRVLCLFPMEPPIYARHGIDARFVGHPLAARLPMIPDRAAARASLGLPQDRPVLAVLPGSRPSEIERLGRIFLEAAQKVGGQIAGLRVIVPAANEACREMLEGMLHQGSGPGTRDPGPVNSEKSASHESSGSNKTEASRHATLSQGSGPGTRDPGPANSEKSASLESSGSNEVEASRHATLSQGSGPGTRDPGPANSEKSASLESSGPNKTEASKHATFSQGSGPGTRDPGPANSEKSASLESSGSNEVEASRHATLSQTSGPGSRVPGPESGIPGPEPGTPGPELLSGHAHQALQAADIVLLASGTATLEAMLAKRPMVVGYRVAPASYRVARALHMLKTDIYALPNILARADDPQAPLPAPERMQDDCTADRLAEAVLVLFADPQRRDRIIATFEHLHRQLLGDMRPDHPAGPAADAIAELIGHV